VGGKTERDGNYFEADLEERNVYEEEHFNDAGNSSSLLGGTVATQNSTSNDTLVARNQGPFLKRLYEDEGVSFLVGNGLCP
jgi:hypothetical protein